MSALPGVEPQHQPIARDFRARTSLAESWTDPAPRVVWDRELGAKKLELPADRIGDLLVLAARDWVIGRRYDHFHLDIGRHPTRYELDRTAPDHPVYVTPTCRHMGVANSRGLAEAGITRDTADPPGGEIVRENGEPTGLLHETAQGLVKSKLPAYEIKDMVAAIEKAGGSVELLAEKSAS